MDLPSISDQAERPYISTRHLPEPELVQRLLSDAHEGQNSQVYPALASVPSDLFGVCVVGTSGRVYQAGDTDDEFSIMSVSKPFVFAGDHPGEPADELSAGRNPGRSAGCPEEGGLIAVQASEGRASNIGEQQWIQSIAGVHCEP